MRSLLKYHIISTSTRKLFFFVNPKKKISNPNFFVAIVHCSTVWDLRQEMFIDFFYFLVFFLNGKTDKLLMT